MKTAGTEFSRLVPLTRVGAGPFAQEITATAEECAALAARFGLLDLERLTARVVLEQWPDDTFLLQADFEAAFIQECVVSLEPVPGTVTDHFTLHYGSPEAEPAVTDDGGDEPVFEPLAGDAIDIGEAVAQEFSLSLPPFPRAPEAVMEIGEVLDDEGPFAASSRFRTPPESA